MQKDARRFGQSIGLKQWQRFNSNMSLAQTPHVPTMDRRPGWRDLGWLCIYAARALVELVRARVIFARLRASDIVDRNHKAKATTPALYRLDEQRLARIAYVIPRLSDRLPWRSDCLIQAIAGQNWLLSYKAVSEIQIGVEHPKDGDFGAHAWLVHHEMVVTGGDIERYHVLLADSRQQGSREASDHET